MFPGGAFFAEFLAGEDARDGPIHEVVVAWERESLEALAEIAREAKRRGELDEGVDPDQLAFELYACMELANHHFVLFRDPAVLDRGRRAVREMLERGRPPRRTRR